MKQLLLIQAMILLVACRGNSNRRNADERINTDTVKPKADSVLVYKAPGEDEKAENKEIDKLIGIWGINSTDNASFEISKTTFYYPEHDKYYKYQVIGDSIKIKYEDYDDSFAFKVIGTDTLILNGMYGKQVFSRRK